MALYVATRRWEMQQHGILQTTSTATRCLTIEIINKVFILHVFSWLLIFIFGKLVIVSQRPSVTVGTSGSVSPTHPPLMFQAAYL